MQKIHIENRCGDYIEKYDIVSKYQRREGLNQISAAQFASIMKEPSERKRSKEMQRNDANRFHFAMLKDSDCCVEFFPDTKTLSDVYPMEPPFMRKR